MFFIDFGGIWMILARFELTIPVHWIGRPILLCSSIIVVGWLFFAKRACRDDYLSYMLTGIFSEIPCQFAA